MRRSLKGWRGVAVVCAMLAVLAGLSVAAPAFAAKPVIEGGEVTSLTPFRASLSAAVNPENESTSCIFEYGETSAFGSTALCEPSTLEGEGAQGISVNLEMLKAGTTYHYHFVAENASGETEGTEGEFTTLPAEAPIVESESISSATSESVRLEARINPNYQKTTYQFEYATNESFTGAEVVPGTEALPEAFEERPVSTTVSGLEPRTTYYFRVVAMNESGTQDGAPVSFETQGTPIVTTGAAESITRTTASISGTVDPGGAPALAQVVYIDQADYEAAVGKGVEDPYAAEGGRLTSSVTVSEADFAAHNVGPFELRELKAGTVYHYAVVATNSVGTTIGPDATFTTSPATPPVATTGEATGITQTAATLNGTVDTRGLRTTMSFEMGETPALGLPEMASVVPGSESGTTVAISLPFANYLPPGTTFYYRARASNADGVSYGEVKTFTTATFPMPPTYSAPTFPLLPVPKVPPVGKRSGSHHKSGSSKKLAKALKACAKKPKRKRAACRRQARRKYGKKG